MALKNFMRSLTKIKSFLKKIPWIYSANAYLKARQASYNRARLLKHYQRLASLNGIEYSETWAREQVQARLRARGIRPAPRERSRLRIFWVGTNWSQDNSGFLQALRKFGEVTTFHNIYGEYGLLNPAKDQGRLSGNVQAYIESNNQCLLTQVREALETGGVDLLLGQMLAIRISADTLRQIQELGIITVNISMDDRLPNLWLPHKGVRAGSIGLCSGLDLVLTSSPETCLWYAVEGCTAIYWPMGSDPDIFSPCEDKIYDVSFVGGRYGWREKIVNEISRAGINIVPFGPGWPNGSIGPKQMAEVFSKSKIVLGIGFVGYNQDILTLKLRDFDATMAGALYITHRNPDLCKLFEEDKEIVCYSTIDECVRKIKYYLAHGKKRKIISTAAAKRARQDHTWQLRISMALDMLGINTDE